MIFLLLQKYNYCTHLIERPVLFLMLILLLLRNCFTYSNASKRIVWKENKIYIMHKRDLFVLTVQVKINNNNFWVEYCLNKMNFDFKKNMFLLFNFR